MVIRSKLLSICLLAALVVLGGCAGDCQDAESSDSATLSKTDSSKVIAYVDGEEVTLAQVEQLAVAKLVELERERYQALKSALDGLVSTRLFDQEAEALGITRDELLQAEVMSKVSEPTELELRTFYEEHKHEAPTPPVFEEVQGQMVRYMQRQQLRGLQQNYLDTLMAKTNSSILLEPPRTQIDIPENAMIKGPADAPITLVEFADYECPSCKRVYRTVDLLLAEYADTIRYIYIDFPLPNHPQAIPASVAAHCAAEQDLFWDYHQNLMLMAGDLSDADLQARAESVGLDGQLFASCYSAAATADQFVANYEYGRTIGVTGAPTFYVNGRMLRGVTATEEFRMLIEEEMPQ